MRKGISNVLSNDFIRNQGPNYLLPSFFGLRFANHISTNKRV